MCPLLGKTGNVLTWRLTVAVGTKTVNLIPFGYHRMLTRGSNCGNDQAYYDLDVRQLINAFLAGPSSEFTIIKKV